MTEDTLLPFDLPAVRRKKVTADFEGGLISSDGGLVLLRGAERRLGLAETLAGCIREWRDPALVVHTLPAMLRFRMFAIACGYEDADDCDALRTDPLFKLAVGRAPESGRALCSQPTMSRLENAPSRLEVARMTAALVDLFCRSFPTPPAAITLDIDDTCDPVHGHQQMSLFHAHYDTRCFLPVHVYHVESGKPVAVLLRPGKTPSGAEVRTLLKHLVRRIRRHWPRTRLTLRTVPMHVARRKNNIPVNELLNGTPAPLAGKSTLNRLEQSWETGNRRYHQMVPNLRKLSNLFVTLFLDAHQTPPARITLDIDATNTAPRHTATQTRPVDRKSSDTKWPREISGSTAQPKAAFVTGLRSRRLPDKTACQLPDQTDNCLGGSFLHWCYAVRSAGQIVVPAPLCSLVRAGR